MYSSVVHFIQCGKVCLEATTCPVNDSLVGVLARALLDEIRASCTVEYDEGNLKHVNDPTEVREERESERVTVTKTIG